MEQSRNEIVLILISVTSASLVILLIIAFIIGCSGGYSLNQRRKRQLQVQESVKSHQDLEQSLEMQENVAYGPLPSVRVSYNNMRV